MANRPLFHARFAGQHNIIAAEAQRRRQRAHRGTGVTEEQLKRAVGLQPLRLTGDVTAVRSSDNRYLTPSSCSALSMWRTSSLSSRLVRRVVPTASAASSRARLETLLEPGRLTVPLTSAIGCNVGFQHVKRVLQNNYGETPQGCGVSGLQRKTVRRAP